MRAAVLLQHGGPEQMVLRTDYPDPQPGPEDVVIRVRACALNYHDIFTRRGMPGIKIPLPLIMGIDMAGDIVALGQKVSGWHVGDRVLVDPRDRRPRGGLIGEVCDGGLAEYCRVPAEQLIRLPDSVDYANAAALPVAYGTAHRMIITHGRIQAGERVLILGASGGVGTGCVLLCKLAGAEVIACGGGEKKLRRLRELGADHVVDYTSEDFVAEVHRLYGKPARREYAGGVNVVINFTGGDTWAKSLRAIQRGGRMLTCGATAGYDPKTDLRYIWTFELEIKGSNGWTPDDLTALLALGAAGKLRPVVDTVLPLEEFQEAFRLMEQRELFGKVILTP